MPGRIDDEADFEVKNVSVDLFKVVLNFLVKFYGDKNLKIVELEEIRKRLSEIENFYKEYRQ